MIKGLTERVYFFTIAAEREDREGQTGRIFCPIGTNWAHLLSHLRCQGAMAYTRLSRHTGGGLPAVSSLLAFSHDVNEDKIMDQGQCGSCWAFLSSGGVEGSWEVSTDSLASLSEQQLIEYSKPNSGCNGGLMDYAFTLHNAKAIASESSYT